MAIIETLFDVISASTGAIFGAIFAFYLNRRRNRRMLNQQVISRQELARIKEENERLLTQIKEKENLILKMQMQLLETGSSYKRKKKK